MGKSLQDQLQALGLAQKPSTKKQAKIDRNPAAGARHKPGRQAKPEKGRSVIDPKQRDDSGLSLEQAYRLREQQTKELAEQTRHRKREEDRKRRQINDEIRVIVEPHRLNDPAAELSRNFMYKGRIRKVSVTREQLKSLNEETLGLVYLAGGYHVLTPEHVAQVRSLSAEHVPDLSGSTEEDDQYPVPDDLVW